MYTVIRMDRNGTKEFSGFARIGDAEKFARTSAMIAKNSGRKIRYIVAKKA